FTYDERGRMLRTNEPLASARRPAPRVFVGRTLVGDVVRFGADIPDALAARLEGILASEPPQRRIGDPLQCRAAVREALTAHAPVASEESGPSYRFPDSFAADLMVGREPTVALTLDTRDLVRDTYPWLYDEILDWPPSFGVVRDGAAVSICFS